MGAIFKGIGELIIFTLRKSNLLEVVGLTLRLLNRPPKISINLTSSIMTGTKRS